MGTCTYQNSSCCILKIYTFHSVQDPSTVMYIKDKLKKKKKEREKKELC